MAAATVVAKTTSIGTDTDAQPNAPVIAITLDTTIQETHTGSNQVTDHPVEEGSNISDHSRPEPDGLTMECMVSNTPISRQQVARAVKQGTVTVQSTAPQQTPGRAEAAYADLLSIKDQGILCSVVTTLKTYRKMAIVNVSLPRTAQESNVVHFTVTFKQVRIVRNKLTRQVVAKDKRPGGKQKLGNKTPESTEVQDSTLNVLVKGAEGKEGFINKLAGAGGALFH